MHQNEINKKVKIFNHYIRLYNPYLKPAATFPVNCSIDLTTFPIIKGNIPFSIFSHNELIGACKNGSNLEAHVIDTYKDWKFVRDRIDSDKIIPEPNLDNNSLLVYLFGQRQFSGNKFGINKIEGVPAAQSMLISILLTDL
jgi:hypothetical protein